MTEEREETWPEVWARYWNPMDAAQVKQWDDELGEVFGRRPADGSIKVNESEVCKALRELGASEKFQTFKPKIGSVIEHIRSARKKEIEDIMGQEASRKKGTVGCLYCMDKGTVLVRFVRFMRDGKKTWRFPKPQMWRGEHPSKPGVQVEMLDLEEHDKILYPCLLCGRGDKHLGNLDRGTVHGILEKYKKHLLLLPNECVRKPDMLRGFTAEPLFAEVGESQPEKVLTLTGATIVETDDGQGESWL